MRAVLYVVAGLVVLGALALVGRVGWKEFLSSARAELVAPTTLALTEDGGPRSVVAAPSGDQPKRDRIELPVVALGMAREQINRLEREKTQIAQERDWLRSEAEGLSNSLNREASLRQSYELLEALRSNAGAEGRKPKMVPGPLVLEKAPGVEGGKPSDMEGHAPSWPDRTRPSAPLQSEPPAAEPVSPLDVKATILNSVSCPSSKDGPGLPVLLDVRMRDVIYEPNERGVPERECTVLARCTGDPSSGRLNASPVLLSCVTPTGGMVGGEHKIKGRLMDSDFKDGLPGTVRRNKDAREAKLMVDALTAEVSRLVGPTVLSTESSGSAAVPDPSVPAAHGEPFDSAAHPERVEGQRQAQGTPVEQPGEPPSADGPRDLEGHASSWPRQADAAEPAPPAPVRKLTERMRKALDAALKEVTEHYGKRKGKRLAVVEVSAGTNVTLVVYSGFDLVGFRMFYPEFRVTPARTEDLPPRFKVGP